MYGKHFASMYTGSMLGKGALFFAVWGYVISHFVPDREHGAWVELNPKLLATILGEDEVAVAATIEAMCQPDGMSRTEVEDGRKLVRLGPFAYRVVNGAKYRAIRDEESRREQNREAQAKYRAKKRRPLRGEVAAVKALKNGDRDGFERIAAEA